MDNKQNASDRIRHIRKDILHKTQEEFAAEIGLDPSHLSRIECGVKGISLDRILRICDTYGLRIDDFVQTVPHDEPFREKLIAELIEVVKGMDIIEISVLVKMMRK